MGHWCGKHQTAFFKTKNMKGYAHPIKGTDPTEWCNEPEEGGESPPELSPTTPTVLPEHQAEIDRAREEVRPKSDGKNRSFALSYAKDIAVAKIMMGGEMTPAHILTTATLFESYLDNGATVEKKED